MKHSRDLVPGMQAVLHDNQRRLTIARGIMDDLGAHSDARIRRACITIIRHGNRVERDRAEPLLKAMKRKLNSTHMNRSPR